MERLRCDRQNTKVQKSVSAEDKLAPVPTVINRAEAKRMFIRVAQDTKFYWTQFEPRVSSDTLNQLQAYAESWIRNHVSKLPSKGKTI